jgi:murein DD-endopeptidase MepM/ murein hydrolase activator NlpD
MTFHDAPLIPTTNLYREARVSAVHGRTIVRQLREAHQITPITTPTGRELLSPRDGEVVFAALTSTGR